MLPDAVARSQVGRGMQLVCETKMHKDLEPWERSVRPCKPLFDVCLPGLALPDFC